MSNEAADFLFGGGGKAAKFEELGDMVVGVIEHCEVSQQTSMEDNTPLTWPDGSARMQLIVTLQTDERDGDDDDGIRRIFAKGGKWEVAKGDGMSMKDAIADAVKKAGAKSLDTGAKLSVAHTGLGKSKNRGYSPPKLYKAKYEPAKQSISEDALFS